MKKTKDLDELAFEAGSLVTSIDALDDFVYVHFVSNNIDHSEKLSGLITVIKQYDEFTIEVQQMIKKKTHSLSPCKI
ncbi:hypothetical protein [Lactiplantibacillus argentoratensis]|uniref:hypothetical protein n=1 Tax=Lactiplantibacillus argentoratensis TaxID=271881 RepID=UPI003F5297DD